MRWRCRKGSKPKHSMARVPAGDFRHGRQRGAVAVEGEGAEGAVPELREQAQGDCGLDAQDAAVAAEQPGQVGPVVPEEGQGVRLSR